MLHDCVCVCVTRLTRREEARRRPRERRRRRFWPPDASSSTSTIWTRTSWSTKSCQDNQHPEPPDHCVGRGEPLNLVVVLLCCCRDKINELYEWMCQLESEKFDHMERLKRQKYEVSTMWPEPTGEMLRGGSHILPEFISIILMWHFSNGKNWQQAPNKPNSLPVQTPNRITHTCWWRIWGNWTTFSPYLFCFSQFLDPIFCVKPF